MESCALHAGFASRFESGIILPLKSFAVETEGNCFECGHCMLMQSHLNPLKDSSA